MGNSHHIVPHKDGWAIKRSGSERSSHVYGTQEEAIDNGRGISRNQGTELVIHDSKGRIRERDSHGSTPARPADKESPMVERIEKAECANTRPGF